MNNNLKLLMVTTRPLIPNNSGYTIRMYNYLKELKKIGIKITLLSFFASKLELTEQYNEICDKIIPIYYNKSLSYLRCMRSIFTNKPFKAEYYNSLNAKKIIEEEIKNNSYDYICGYHYLTEQFLKKYPNKKWIDLCDAISLLHERNINTSKNFFNKLFLKIEKERVLNIEKQCIQNFDIVTLISDVDKDFLNSFIDCAKVKIVKNGVFEPINSNIRYNSNEICFLGDMGYVQNHQACTYFIKNILPKLQEKNQNISFKIVGKNPKSELYELATLYKNITITGRVDDITKELQTSNVMVCPISISAGLQNKVLEAMALGIPTIVTKQIAQPITLDEQILIQANSEEEWLNNIQLLVNNPTIREQYSITGKKFVKEHYNWEIEVRKLGINNE